MTGSPFASGGIFTDALAINQTGAVAERMQRAQPGQLVSVEVPIVVLDVQAGIMADNKSIGVRFVTSIGAPLVFSMPRNIAQTAIERLSAELENLDKQSPFRPS